MDAEKQLEAAQRQLDLFGIERKDTRGREISLATRIYTLKIGLDVLAQREEDDEPCPDWDEDQEVIVLSLPSGFLELHGEALIDGVLEDVTQYIADILGPDPEDN